jgi:2-dehydro-3-deoxyphosphooctonate aldolase (KDO 8-P synthase)
MTASGGTRLTPRGLRIANDAPFVLLGGVNVIESREFALEVAAEYAAVCAELRHPPGLQGVLRQGQPLVDSLLSRPGSGGGPELPAFLARQTDLVQAMAATGR